MAGGFRLPRVGTAEDPLRLAVFISGSGSGLQALLDHQLALGDEARHVTSVVVSDVAGVKGLERARAAGVAAEAVPLPPLEGPESALPPRGSPDRAALLRARREAHEVAVEAALAQHEPELIVLSGYMRVLTNTFVDRWAGRLVNIHPALLPSFPGAYGITEAFTYGVKVTGCTVHFVDPGVDTGPIIAQASVPVLEGDDEGTLKARVQAAEHGLYPQVIDALAAGRVQVEGRRVRVRDSN